MVESSFSKRTATFKGMQLPNGTVTRKMVTKSLFMGFVGIDEGNKAGDGTVGLECLSKGGTLNEVQPGKWEAVDNHKEHRNYIYGDRKSIELLEAFKCDLQSRGLSISDTSAQCEEFEKGLDTFLCQPGDWHTGLNQVQTIFKFFYKPLIGPIQDMLHWKRINEQVKNCYL